MSVHIQDWDGEPITEPGLYRGIPLQAYHNDIRLLSGPSVSKSNLKHIAPPDGSPKKFYRFWAGNPNRKIPTQSRALTFGRAAHALLLGDEVFDEKFIIRPERVDGYLYQGNRTEWRNWYKEQAALGLEVITEEEIEQIRDMSADAAKHPLVISGGMNGEVEISMFAKDPETKLWLKSRPDVFVTDGIYNDFKTCSSMDEEFLQTQFEESGYYLQAGLTKTICDLLGLPFISFGFLYGMSKDYADTEYRVASNEDIALGQAVIRYGLKKIRHGINTGEWDGASTYARENYPMKMKPWPRNKIEAALQKEGIL